MTLLEIVVSIAGLVVGFILVNQFMGKAEAPPPPADDPRHPTRNEVD
jgi:hypothetical protein